ncbi:SDR family NAD(P)-dependent oxidoreductase [Mycolicibacterium sp.]|uniref:SDR family NAD(P)-dependent oxidoreductase n=1 Tax=Mycolicibacterium sp. TaxID=2320850 RepID=UPI0028ADD2C9|nr:SDR family NAD(P)-dependent oxidoreductase [Mycolicibacterium sp.]
MTDLQDLTGHVALVTGGNSGIGLGMARGLRKAGAAVVIWGTNAERNAAAVAELSADSPDAPVAAFRVDVSDEDAVNDGVARTLETFGAIDSCFANAGVSGRPSPIDTMTTAEWRRVMGVNLDGQFFTVRAVAGHMKQRHSGSIVFTSSVSMTDGLPFAVHYAASKAALAAMARGLAVELARDGIRANAIVPGWTKAAMTEDLLESPAAQTKILPRVPMRRWGVPQDFEALAVWLAGPGSGYVTGQTIVVDGGYSVF